MKKQKYKCKGKNCKKTLEYSSFIHKEPYKLGKVHYCLDCWVKELKDGNWKILQKDRTTKRTKIISVILNNSINMGVVCSVWEAKYHNTHINNDNSDMAIIPDIHDIHRISTKQKRRTRRKPNTKNKKPMGKIK